ncbi:hypothetical protein [Proteocatella sphenisci]|uniref:hypothetical protein n=1 Tax=Proteocatella sphenisci TaxID=181070 RepID=UPI00048DD11C|nr:hypothetical protein [Proteocatella sphenisci]
MKTKKVMLFIVEGITDKISLGEIISKLIKNQEVRFYIINGDVTSDGATNQKNAVDKMASRISRYCKNNFLKRTDISQIVHLVDSDGAYIDDKHIERVKAGGLKYTTKHIYAKSVKFVQERNEKKREILDVLCDQPTILGIKYNVYYFSCNLEHVLHGDIDMPDRKKRIQAEEFADMFYKREQEFIEFINNPEFAVKGNYQQTWDFVKQDRNSLNRYSNFHLFFDAK